MHVMASEIHGFGGLSFSSIIILSELTIKRVVGPCRFVRILKD